MKQPKPHKPDGVLFQTHGAIVTQSGADYYLPRNAANQLLAIGWAHGAEDTNHHGLPMRIELNPYAPKEQP